MIHQWVAWLQWSVSMVLALPKVSDRWRLPCFMSMIRAVSFFDCTRLEASWASHGEDGWHHGSSNIVASSVGQPQIINFCAQGSPNILPHRHHFLHCLLLPLHWIPWSSCTEHVPKLYSMESLMKLPFQQVVIDPKRTPDEEVMVVLLRHYALSWETHEDSCWAYSSSNHRRDFRSRGPRTHMSCGPHCIRERVLGCNLLM